VVFRMCAAAICAGIIGGLATRIVQPAPSAQQPACLHGPGETEADRQLRVQALSAARAINTRQSELASRGDYVYVPLERLGTIRVAPAGFETELVTDAKAYAFSIKDTRDPCRFTLFSDQNGVIFVGEALR
jgi:hypothetical protein